MENTYNKKEKPKFDPNKPFQEVDQPAPQAKPKFDPSKPFQEVNAETPAATPKKKDDTASSGPSSATRFTLPLDQEPNDPVAKSILQNKRRALGKSGDQDPRKRLAGNLANDTWSLTDAMSAPAKGKFLSRDNMNATQKDFAKDLRVAANTDPKKLQAAQRATRIEQGDINEITSYTKQKRQELKQAKAEAFDQDIVAGGGGMYSMGIGSATETRESKEARSAIDDQEEDLLTTAAASIRHSIVDEYERSEKTTEDRKKLGTQLRKAFSDIGVNPKGSTLTSVQDEEGMIAAAAPDKKKEYQAEHDYNNEMEVLKSLVEVKGQRLDTLMADPDVIAYWNGDDNQAGNPKVIEAIRLAQDLKGTEADYNKIQERYPTMKNAQDRENVIDAFAQYLTKQKESGYESDEVGTRVKTFGKDIAGLVVGDAIDTDEEVNAIAQATGYTPERVRELAKDYKLPSELRRGAEYFANTFRSVAQFANRKLMDDKGAADLVNKEIEARKYKAPESRRLSMDNLKKFNIYALTDQVLETALQGTSEFAAYSVVTGGIGGLVRGTGMVGAELATAIGSRLPVGAAEAIATKAPRLAQLFGGAGEAGSGMAKVVERAGRARDLAATYATGYASSYEDSYQEAKRFTGDEKKREAYASSISFLNGISELILPDIDVAKKLAAIGSVKQLLREGEVNLTRADVVKNFMAKLGETVGQETLEEYIPMVGEVLAKQSLFGYQTSTSEFLNTLAETTINTVVSSAGMGLGSANVGSSSRLTKQALFEAGKTPERSLSYLDRLEERGVLSPEETNKRRQMVNTMNDVVTKLPNENNAGAELSEHAKVELAAANYDIRASEEEKRNVDKSFHAGPNARIKAAQARIDAIMGGVRTPVEEELDEEEATGPTNEADPASAPDDRADTTAPTTDDEDSTSAWDDIGFGLFAPENKPNAPDITPVNDQGKAAPARPATKQTLRATNPIAQRFLDEHLILNVDDLTDDDTFTLRLDATEAATAQSLGAERFNLGGNAMVTFTGQQLKTFLNTNQDATQESQTQVGQSVPQSGQQQYVNPVTGEQAVEGQQQTQPSATDSNSNVSSRAKKEIGNLLGSTVNYRGNRVYLFQEGQRVIGRTPEGREYDIANVEDETPLAELQIDNNLITSNEDGSLSVYGQRLRPKHSNPRKAFTYDGAGNITSVSLIDEQGNTQTFIDQQAQDIAYEITLQRPRPSGVGTLRLTTEGKLVRNEEAATTNIVQEEQGTNDTSQAQPQSEGETGTVPEQSGITRISGIYEFGQVQPFEVTDIVNDRTFNKRNADIKTVERLRTGPIEQTMLVFRHPNGTVHILEGKEIYQAAKHSNQPLVNVRFFNGTVEQAMDFVAARTPFTEAEKKAYIDKRVSRVLSIQPKTFEAYILQQVLGMATTRKQRGRKNAFSLDDFVRIMGFGGIDNNPHSPSYGKRTGMDDIRWLSLNAILSNDKKKYGIITVEEAIEAWVSDNPNADQGDLRNTFGSTILNYQGRDALLARLEFINDIREAPLRPEMATIHMNEEELLFAAENDLGDLLNQIIENADGVDISEAEEAYLNDLVRRFDSPERLNVDGMANELFFSQEPVAVSLRQKLLDYGSIQEVQYNETNGEPVGDIGSETILADQDEEENWFSRKVNEGTRLSAKQAAKVGKALSKAFKGLKVSVDREAFQNALAKATGQQSKQLSERAIYLTNLLEAARKELVNAERARNSKAQQLDRNVRQDAEDLFGQRQAAPTGMFDERVDPKARAAAMKPFVDRYNKARNRVNELTTQLAEASKQGPQQTTMFQKATSAPTFALPLLSNGELINSDNPIENKQENDTLREELNQLNELLNCIYG